MENYLMLRTNNLTSVQEYYEGETVTLLVIF